MGALAHDMPYAPRAIDVAVGVPQTRTCSVSRPDRDGSAHGSGCNFGHDPLQHVPHSLRVSGRHLCTAHFARKPPSYPELGGNGTPACRGRRGLYTCLRPICYQRPTSSLSLDHRFTLPGLLCAHGSNQLRRFRGTRLGDLHRSLRANIDETVLLVLITEQGENRNQCEEQRNIFCFSHGFACR